MNEQKTALVATTSGLMHIDKLVQPANKHVKKRYSFRELAVQSKKAAVG